MQRDVLGIPTITAGDTYDLFYAAGGTCRPLREMDFRRHVTAGRVSKLFRESQLATDKFLRTLGWHETAEQEVEALDPTVHAYYDAYAEGVNAYLSENHGVEASFEYAVLGLQNPGTTSSRGPVDSVAWLKAMAWDLRSNIEIETERAIAAATSARRNWPSSIRLPVRPQSRDRPDHFECPRRRNSRLHRGVRRARIGHRRLDRVVGGRRRHRSGGRPRRRRG